MTGKERVVNFCYQIDRPFTAKEVSEKCDVNYNTCKRHLLALRKDGKIRIMNKKGGSNLLIWNEQTKEIKDNYDWQPSREKLEKLLKSIASRPKRACDLANILSAKTVQRYTQILSVLGNIRKDERGYYHLVRSDLPAKIDSYKITKEQFASADIPLRKPEEYKRMQAECSEPKLACELFRRGFNLAMVRRAVERGFIVREGNHYIARER